MKADDPITRQDSSSDLTEALHAAHRFAADALRRVNSGTPRDLL